MDAERRRYFGTIVEAKLTFSPSRERILGTDTATSPTAVVTSRSGKWPFRTTWAHAAFTKLSQNAFDLHLQRAVGQGSGVSAQQFSDRVSHLALRIGRCVEVGRYNCHG
jgi:hypothetical protein